jgi:glycerol-3-phosphate acyltransferase PlsX
MAASKLQLPIALDAMGGDHAPLSVLKGAEQALIRHPGIKFLLFGDQELIAPYLTSLPNLQKNSEIVHTDQAIANDDKPSQAVRKGRKSSMWLSIDAVEQGRACAIVSAGNTGALMAMAKLILRTLPGVSRPAIAALFPTLRGECVMLDLGANVESDAQDLYRFAIMGDAFARAVLGLNKPRIALLNIGSEELKGRDEIKEAAGLLKASPLKLNFKGFIEGNDITQGHADVIVSDGFTGNIALKTAEGVARLIRNYLKDALNSSPLAKLGSLFAFGAFSILKDKLDDRKRNGAMFLGLNGICVKSHGGADAVSFCNAISVAVELVAHNINTRITQEITMAAQSSLSLDAVEGDAN